LGYQLKQWNFSLKTGDYPLKKQQENTSLKTTGEYQLKNNRRIPA
jgi:hypothetical protein